MINTVVTLINQLGLHARASAKFVATASRFQSCLEVKHKDKTVNGKSIMGVMLLAAANGSELELTIEGPDEEAMEHAIKALIAKRFDEEQ